MSRYIRLILMLSFLVLALVVVLVVGPSVGDYWGNILFNSDSARYPLTINCFMWLVLSLGLGDIAYRVYSAHVQSAALRSGYLPEDEKRVLTVNDMAELYRSVKTEKSELAGLVSSLALRFQAGKSVEQTHQLLSSQLELWQFRLDVDYATVRYITWLIPTVGFIGTVVGISQGLAFAGSGQVSPDSEAFLPAITQQLGLAFNTTLLALVMSVLLVFLSQLVQAREERLVEATGRYCLDNLITRLYISH